ncbi:MAG: crotonyl-CoA carboxylase/reductase [Deltaproteobacteria bacterium]|nr:crotonyl-CoA carboxylase/reductase [Deltaproteobacteria bacterium]
MTKEFYELGEIPPLGEVPKKMIAQVVRPDRFGPPIRAFQQEVVDIPEIRPDECLVYVMSAGVNYNNVWAALGVPIDVTKARPKDPFFPDTTGFHVGGSDASGVIWKVGSAVKNVKVGDEVVIHCGMWSQSEPLVQSGEDPMYSPSFRIWGYETNWGSFAQFTRVQAHQCLPKPKNLTWEAASAYMLVGATAYRMLHGWPEHKVREGDVVLVWGASGGLGSMAIQIVKAAGGIPVAVVGGDDKVDFCKKLGAKGVINRKLFNHWGMLPHWKDTEKYNQWLSGARAFGKALWEAVGEKKSPRIVFEHPGEDTVPTSAFVCDTGGMIVICAGTSGYNATIDLRYHWMRQKRFQGSHFANDDQARGLNDLVIDGKVDPCLGEVFDFKETGACHQLMNENKHAAGNMAILVNAGKKGIKNLDEARKA